MTVHGIKRRLDRLETPGIPAKVDFSGVPDEELARAISIFDSYSVGEDRDTVARFRAGVAHSASRVAMDAEVCAQCPVIVKALAEHRGY
jgi:hypothetical protein